LPDFAAIKNILYLIAAITSGFFIFRTLRNKAKAKSDSAKKDALLNEYEANALYEDVKKLAGKKESLDDYKAHVKRVEELMKI